jgi:hypothetical protein
VAAPILLADPIHRCFVVVPIRRCFVVNPSHLAAVEVAPNLPVVPSCFLLLFSS